jgi:hypothetical protein
MTRDELWVRLRAIAERELNDRTLDHIDADEALLEFIGDPLIREAYEAIEIRYS